jgi:hypothetical protein
MKIEIPDHLINEPMFHGMLRLIGAAKRARWTNAVTRQDAKETRYEADWIKHMRIIEPYYEPPPRPVQKEQDDGIQST